MCGSRERLRVNPSLMCHSAILSSYDFSLDVCAWCLQELARYRTKNWCRLTMMWFDDVIYGMSRLDARRDLNCFEQMCVCHVHSYFTHVTCHFIVTYYRVNCLEWRTLRLCDVSWPDTCFWFVLHARTTWGVSSKPVVDDPEVIVNSVSYFLVANYAKFWSRAILFVSDSFSRRLSFNILRLYNNRRRYCASFVRLCVILCLWCQMVSKCSTGVYWDSWQSAF
jgi:hypothetical protein